METSMRCDHRYKDIPHPEWTCTMLRICEKCGEPPYPCVHKYIQDAEVSGLFKCLYCPSEVVHSCAEGEFVPWHGMSCEACELGLTTAPRSLG